MKVVIACAVIVCVMSYIQAQTTTAQLQTTTDEREMMSAEERKEMRKERKEEVRRLARKMENLSRALKFSCGREFLDDLEERVENNLNPEPEEIDRVERKENNVKSKLAMATKAVRLFKRAMDACELPPERVMEGISGQPEDMTTTASNTG